jgi:ubiquinone/menaquinone biosynthesis C-methylase UbiE
MRSIAIAGGDTGTPENLAKRLTIIAEHLQPGWRILDAGCGSGDYVEALGRRGYDVRGIEYSSQKVATWHSRHPADTRVQQGDIARLPFADECFDAAILNEVLEHVPDERAVLAELARVLRWRGILIVFSPSRRYPFETHGLDAWGDGHRIRPIRTFGIPWVPRELAFRIGRPWARNYWPHQLRRLVRDAGFSIYRTQYVWQTFENISGTRGRILTTFAPFLRRLARVLERAPFVRTFGVSQMIVAERS